MRSLSNLGLSLCVIFACLFIALVGELYYLWWKKSSSERETEKRHGSAQTELFFMFCKRRSSSISQKARSRHEQGEKKGSEPESQLKILQSKKDFLVKPLEEEEEEEDDLEAELTRLQGPPRFLYTIIEETKEDLEAENLILTVETPFLTPLNSPSLFPPLTPTESYKQNGFNPLSESMSDAEFNKMRSSPPPTFKFLLDAEEKLKRKLMEEEAKRDVVEEDGCCITVIVDVKKDQKESHHHSRFPQLHSNNWQVLPLDYSPQNHLQKPKTNL